MGNKELRIIGGQKDLMMLEVSIWCKRCSLMPKI